MNYFAMFIILGTLFCVYWLVLRLLILFEKRNIHKQILLSMSKKIAANNLGQIMLRSNKEKEQYPTLYTYLSQNEYIVFEGVKQLLKVKPCPVHSCFDYKQFVLERRNAPKELNDLLESTRDMAYNLIKTLYPIKTKKRDISLRVLICILSLFIRLFSVPRSDNQKKEPLVSNALEGTNAALGNPCLTKA